MTLRLSFQQTQQNTKLIIHKCTQKIGSWYTKPLHTLDVTTNTNKYTRIHKAINRFNDCFWQKKKNNSYVTNKPYRNYIYKCKKPKQKQISQYYTDL